MQRFKGVASGKQSFREHCATKYFRGHSTKYKCLENFALYDIVIINAQTFLLEGFVAAFACSWSPLVTGCQGNEPSQRGRSPQDKHLVSRAQDEV